MRKHLPRLLLLLLLAALLYFALRNAPLTEIWSTLRQLRLWQIAALMGVNAGIYALVTLRWWIITQAEAKRVPYFPLLLVRVAVFGVSYFTLGPQVGGEPLQALALRRRYGLTYTRATATVLMDKLLEFLANFVLLAFGLAAIFEAGILPTNGSRPIVSLIGIVLLLAWPPIHIILLRRGGHPISSILRVFPKRKATRFLAASERMAGAFCRRHFKALLVVELVETWPPFSFHCWARSAWSATFLITFFLNIELTSWQVVASWTMSWLAFLVPLPGGLGALEASQVFALGAFGVSAASALGVTLLIRARDLLIGGLGLLLAGRGMAK